MEKILIIDDDAVLCKTLQRKFEREGYRAVVAHDGQQGLDLVRKCQPELIILEAKLPILDGFAVCRILRFESDIPILMLTTCQNEADRVLGLDLGADDYVIKPFLENELLARIRALLRRSERPLRRIERKLVTTGDLTIDLDNRRVFRGDEEIHLAQKEFDLLVCLVDHRDVTITRELLLEQVWGAGFKSDVRTIDVHIRWLRAKIELDSAHPRYIHTVRGFGYRFSDETRSSRMRANSG